MEFRRITERKTAVLRQATIRPPALRWAAWAERLLRRHALGSGAWRSLDAVLRQNATSRGETFVDGRVSLAFGLTLTIPAVRAMFAPPVTTVIRRATIVNGERAILPTRIGRATPSDRIVPVIQQARLEQHYHDDRSALAILRQTDQRLLQTHTLAAVERIYARQGQHFESWGSAPPAVAQVVKQPEAAAQTVTAPHNPFAPEAAFTPLRHWDSATAQAAPPDIARLTDQVMRSIDERLTASRERFGKR